MSNIIGKYNFKRMRHSLHLVITALTLFYIGGTSFRKITTMLEILYNIKVSHVTISDWCKKFAPFFTLIGVPNIRVASFKDDISNNVIEAFNKQFKYWYKTRYGFNSFESANSMIMMFVFFFNFIRPHSSLSNLTPAQVAGLEYSKRQQNSLLLVS